MLKEYFNLIEEIPENKQLVLYGFNDLARIIYKIYKKNVAVILDKNKKGDYYNNILITDIDNFEYNENYIFVVTAINEHFINEIKQNLIEKFPQALILNINHNSKKHFNTHKFLENIPLTEESQIRSEFFLKSEEIQMSIFLEFIKLMNPDIVFDIGANVGLYTLISHKYYPQISYFCFEPTPNVFQDLRNNVEFIEKEHKIELFDFALSSKKEKQDFFDFGKSSGRNGIVSTNIHSYASDLATLIEVDSNTLDSMIDTNNKTYLLKIDTEGHEYDILLGSKKMLIQNNCVIQLEFEYLDKEEIIAFFKTINYEYIFSIGPESYFSNISILKDIFIQKSLLERATSKLIYTKWNKEYE